MAATVEETTPTWEELLSSKNWDTLLDPLNLSLRRLILRCGDFCQAAHDAFNNDNYSKYCGHSRYGKSTFFDKVMLDSPFDYFVSSFLYATARLNVPEAFILRSKCREKRDRESNWIGYVAVTSDKRSKTLGRREVYVVWRGTNRDCEWVDVLGAEHTSAESLLHHSIVVPKTKETIESDEDEETSAKLPNYPPENSKTPKVMNGWLTIYTSEDPNSEFTKSSARFQLLAHLRELTEKYKKEKLSIIFTGHSLGACLSVIGALDVTENITAGDDKIPVTAFLFGCPKIGNKAFRDRIEHHKNLHILHIKNTIDVIPHYPPKLLGYVYVGKELVIDTRKSNFLKKSKNPGDWHNLQALLHIVAGWNGENGEFELKVKRSVALVNKFSEYLKEEYLVPGFWWVERNKGLVKDENGEWVCAPPDGGGDEDLPVSGVCLTVRKMVRLFGCTCL